MAARIAGVFTIVDDFRATAIRRCGPAFGLTHPDWHIRMRPFAFNRPPAPIRNFWRLNSIVRDPKGCDHRSGNHSIPALTPAHEQKPPCGAGVHTNHGWITDAS